VTEQARVHGSLLTQSWVQACQLLTRWRRDQGVLLGSLLLPVFLLVVYQVVLGPQVHKVTGVDSVYGLVPLCTILSAVFGALGGAVGIQMERDWRLLSRMWVLPVHRASTIIGRLAAEALRALVGTVLITAIGVGLGLRFIHGWPTVLLYILIPSIAAVGYTAVVMAVAIRSNGRTIMTWLVAATVSLAFLNPGTTPINQFPDWLRPLVRFQPMSPPIEAMWALAHGGALVGPMTMTLLWTIVLMAVFVPIAVRGYRHAAESSA
jgi:ABC-2 type transport system permease protein